MTKLSVIFCPLTFQSSEPKRKKVSSYSNLQFKITIFPSNPVQRLAQQLKNKPIAYPALNFKKFNNKIESLGLELILRTVIPGMIRQKAAIYL